VVAGSSGLFEAAGEGDGERVECLFPAVAAGAEFSSSLVADVADG
jgi:hypothetical protein